LYCLKEIHTDFCISYIDKGMMAGKKSKAIGKRISSPSELCSNIEKEFEVCNPPDIRPFAQTELAPISTCMIGYRNLELESFTTCALINSPLGC
jgi:hypothetical protein